MRSVIFKATIILIFFTASLHAGGEESDKHTSTFNQIWLKALVSIEIIKKGKDPIPIGSGFLCKTPNKHLALITAKHVVFEDDGKGNLKEGLAYRFNDKEGGSELISEQLSKMYHKSSWIRSKTNDVACRLAVKK